MKITALIPTYRRTQDLKRCLDALTKQQRAPDEVLVVVRDTDIETQRFFAEAPFDSLPIIICTATTPGQVAALNTGLDHASGDIIAITDDDAMPHSDWLQRIEAHFANNSSIGGVGGRDWVYLGDNLLEGTAQRVGKIAWFGRVTGNHHLGSGQARPVDVLKGANMSYRKAAIQDLRFDTTLRGSGAQVHNDMAFSSSLRRQGWILIYDPAVAVNHYPAQRFDEDARNSFSVVAQINAAHNETVILLNYFSGLQQFTYLIWSFLIGTKVYPGLAQLGRLLPREGSLVWQKFIATCQGRWQGLQTWLAQPSVEVTS